MRDSSRLTRKPWQRENIVAVRERLQRARERMEVGGKLGYRKPEMPQPRGVGALSVALEALESALLIHAYDQESALEIVADAFVLVQAERNCRERGE